MEKTAMRNLCKTYISKGATIVPEHVSKQIIEGYGIRIPEGAVVKTSEEGIKFAEKVGYPMVLKAVSTKILHKMETQRGGFKSAVP